MFSELSASSRHFYQFLGIHSFLVGLFPFFVPVFLWQQGYRLAQISAFIALTGVGFLLALWAWDRLHKRLRFRSIIAISFSLDVLLLSAVFLAAEPVFLVLFALLNGAYNCFFWITQRALFFETLSQADSGRKVGNFQIFVVITLKLGVFCGGLLLDKAGYLSVYLFSLLVALLGLTSFLMLRQPPELPASLRSDPPLDLGDLLRFRDPHRSGPVFLLDGPFLFLESYFWMISLFLIAHESFWKLGILVILLGGTFSLLFLVIKNRIDRMPLQHVYLFAVAGYALSWWWRALVNEELALGWLFFLLVIITFATSFFRLAFNKRFFDLAKEGSAHRYLFLKSYYSQAAIAVSFAVVAASLSTTAANGEILKSGYALAAIMAPFYLLYRGRARPAADATGNDQRGAAADRTPPAADHRDG